MGTDYSSVPIYDNTKTMKESNLLFMGLIMLAVMMSSFKKDDVVTIFMIGDSTMANKNI